MMIDCTHDFVHLLKSSDESTHDFLGKGSNTMINDSLSAPINHFNRFSCDLLIIIYFLDLFNNLSLKIICKTAMGVDIDFEDEQSNTYRYDVERIKNTLRIRANNPVYWYEVSSISFNQSIWPHLTD